MRSNFKYVPKQMKEKNNWGFWKLSKTSLPTEKPKKMPLKAIWQEDKALLGSASTTNYEDWVSYENMIMLSRHQNVYKNVSGIGYVFKKEDNITFIDFDHCFENGVMNEFAKAICKRFENTYQEISQSGEGIHIFALGNIEKTIKTSEIEMYDDKRYVAFTGNSINSKDLCNYQTEITKLWNEYKDEKKEKEIIQIPYDENDKQSVLENIKNSKQWYKFDAFYNGRVPKNSENTLALACMLCFWTRDNYGLVKEMLMESGLYREKFISRRGNKTWIDIVIEQAMSEPHDVYNPEKNNVYRERNYKKELEKVELTDVELYKPIEQIKYSTDMKERSLSNIRQLDKMVGGFTYDCITLWTSQTNGGKSTMLGQITRELIKQGKKVFYFAGEHTYENLQSILYKQVARAGDFEEKRYGETEIYDYFIKPESLERIEKFYKGNIFIYNNDISRDIDTMIYAMEQVNELYGVRDFVIDNLMQIEMPSSDLNRSQTDVAEKLRKFSINHKCNIHLVAHPRKGQDNSIRLSLFDVSGTQNIPNKSYNIISLIRKDQLRTETKEYSELRNYCYHKGYDFDNADCIVEVLKQKEGTGTGIVCLKFNRMTKQYEEMEKNANLNFEEKLNNNVVKLRKREQN